MYGYVFSEGRFDIGKKIDYLRATVELALRPRRPRPGVPGVPRRRRADAKAWSDRSWSRSDAADPARRGRRLRRSTGCRAARRSGGPAGRRARALVTAEAVAATEPVPPFANTAIDGFAVRAADVAARAGRRSTVVGTIAAGIRRATSTVGPGQAVRIMTGAPMPAGADAVVMVEDTRPASPTATGDGRHRSAVGRAGRPARPAGRRRPRRRRPGRRGRAPS